MMSGRSHSGPAAPWPAATTSSAEPSVAALLSVVPAQGASPPGVVVLAADATTAPVPATSVTAASAVTMRTARFPCLDLMVPPTFRCRA